jgi:hypothetical protein
MSLTTEPINDWCLDLTGPSPGVWIVTDAAWYHLGAPAAGYIPSYTPMIRRLDIALRALRVLRADPAAPADAARAKVLSGAVVGLAGARPYSLHALDGEAAFLAGQLEALWQVGGAVTGDGVAAPSS